MPKKSPRPDPRQRPTMKRWGMQAGKTFLIVYARTRALAARTLADHMKATVCHAEIVNIGPESFSPKAQGRDAA